ncbi:hypothetical protein CK203_107126 [Vitis vinifera]|uniref:Retrotransposon gag domain-containing protein n=1 Tax=Vitis vinifera TaxID=29760 RepID=A0A438DH52_VITVI|nr:hypothetical protein CK203_107126 [Vitis vinifera]
MEKGLEDLREQIQDLREGVLGPQFQPVSHEEFMSFQDKVMSMFASMESRVEALATRIEARDQEIRQELTIYKIVVSARVMATHEAPRVEVSKPHTFSDKRDPKDLENFLWHVECYFEAMVASKDVAYLARKNMKRLKHTGSIREYVKEFSTLTLETPNMSEEELLFNFMDNLQSWVEQKLRRRGGGDKGSRGYTPKEGSSKTFSGKDGKGKDKRKEFTPRTNCFLCDKPHWARDYPKRKALNAMIKEKEKEGNAHVGSLQLLNALKAKLVPKTPQSKGLMYVEALVNGMDTKALEGRVDFTVALMDDFKMVLGMDFLQKVKVVPLPFLGSMAILEEEKSCMVPTITEGSPKTLMLSAMQVKKGLKRKEVTYLATLKEEKDDGSGEPMPKEIKRVLDEFKDVMPPKLPKRLPPRRKEDHKIELEPGVKPLTMGPYKMVSPSWRS